MASARRTTHNFAAQQQSLGAQRFVERELC
jgi:hypothetical protein